MHSINTSMKYRFDFALTTYCQAKCRSCARTNEVTGEKEHWLELKHMDHDVFRNRLESMRGKNIDYIQFCGEFGDPMMHPQVTDFIDTSFEYTRHVQINTNGGLRQPEWYKQQAIKWNSDNQDQRFQGLEISWGIDGVTHDTNNLYREGVDTERAFANMESWFRHGGKGAWAYLIFDWNWQGIPEAAQIAKDIGCEIEFKFNNRNHGRITEENKKLAVELLRSLT
jgi:hypothetical protein